ncbi:accessory gene regulator B family protein [Paenibacillus alvei]|uniref:Accessory gene regulator B family protein n=1 Tax=Paenibacillus alvei TaxID=44250 RepID=A0ABT4GZI9_PAEAL|nr:accessory gene regulator B family protein [Paenibacillus alvei]EJW14657.1 putative membrane protein [Paenibacillus alvei DSM 29]MCY9542726.1 accessory gene regulator B family protein [Paenibacillus alvei]MCY9708046.1 accessory gene regulator B family protein [Paenibacillus alvei]MCY9733868.1 accessory gene regulator B family protein [Paenibacillus alvei]MCY9758517.1 accessory gene regulator B family protein [Paenibacillus alvei]
MIERVSKGLATFLRRNGSHVSHEVLTYAFANILNILLVTTSSIAIGFISGRPIDTIVSLVAFAVIRHFSGGLHAKTMDQCFIVSTMIIVVPAHIVLPSSAIIAITVTCLMIFILFAPNITEDLNDAKDNKIRNKVISVVLVGINLYVQSSTLTLVYLAQALLIIPYSYSRKGG